MSAASYPWEFPSVERLIVIGAGRLIIVGRPRFIDDQIISTAQSTVPHPRWMNDRAEATDWR